jgi:predicted ribosome-associated RNA-binding protein Tma20
MILSVDASVPDLPNVVIHDRAVDAVCHGARLAGVGIIRSDNFKKDDTVVVLSRKNEFVGLGRALVPASEGSPGTPGLVIAPTTVFLQPGTYPRGWKKKTEER